MDNLDMDSVRCKAAGYGVRYGDWKAKNPNTKEVRADDGTMEKSCAFCGKRFKTKNKRKVFCCEECCHNAQVAKRAAKKAREIVLG
jgi:ribosomal protein L37AE/L43A